MRHFKKLEMQKLAESTTYLPKPKVVQCKPRFRRRQWGSRARRSVGGAGVGILFEVGKELFFLALQVLGLLVVHVGEELGDRSLAQTLRLVQRLKRIKGKARAQYIVVKVRGVSKNESYARRKVTK